MKNDTISKETLEPYFFRRLVSLGRWQSYVSQMIFIFWQHNSDRKYGHQQKELWPCTIYFLFLWFRQIITRNLFDAPHTPPILISTIALFQAINVLTTGSTMKMVSSFCLFFLFLVRVEMVFDELQYHNIKAIECLDVAVLHFNYIFARNIRFWFEGFYIILVMHRKRENVQLLRSIHTVYAPKILNEQTKTLPSYWIIEMAKRKYTGSFLLVSLNDGSRTILIKNPPHKCTYNRTMGSNNGMASVFSQNWTK